MQLRFPKLILGSKSPRRHQLLTDAGFRFECRTQDCDESFRQDIPVLEVALMLAYRKADALKQNLKIDELLITADSVVILDGEIYNKPIDYNDGFTILSKLSGRDHTVATGVVLTSAEKQDGFTCTTKVAFDTFSGEEIDYYLTQFKPYDKAGAYGIQDWIGLCKVKSIEGSYSNVMGLPMHELYESLRRF